MSLSKNASPLLTPCKDLASSIYVSKCLLLLVLTFKFLFFIAVVFLIKTSFNLQLKVIFIPEQQSSNTIVTLIPSRRVAKFEKIAHTHTHIYSSLSHDYFRFNVIG